MGGIMSGLIKLASPLGLIVTAMGGERYQIADERGHIIREEATDKPGTL